MDWLNVLMFPLVRAVSGYLQNALSDGKLEFIEWKKLVETILVIIIPVTVAHYGFNADEVTVASIITLLLIFMDQIKRSIVKIKNK